MPDNVINLIPWLLITAVVITVIFDYLIEDTW